MFKRFRRVNKPPKPIVVRRAKAEKMFTDGAKVKDIAKELGVSKTTVYTYLEGVRHAVKRSNKAS